ncbi:MAG: tRNA epoxyqueuosine(34) reductase QueG [Bacteroidales bacterium]|nr:tRNA epoxyqueuosine(34) reductase QueG [Bacteroidales bacterium]
MDKKQLSNFLKEKAFEAGFDFFGVSLPAVLEREAEALKVRSALSYTASMSYLDRDIDKRSNPALVNAGLKSIISVAVNYSPSIKQLTSGRYKLARYAHGKDYHGVIHEMLDILCNSIREVTKPDLLKTFVDDTGLIEKAWAVRAGLGSIGKNTLLITPKGSFFFLGEILTDIELEPTNAIEKDICGDCSLCMESCPTGALVGARTLDARRCLSYQTIENKEGIAKEYFGHGSGFIFGCDICQDVCPYNQKPIPTEIDTFYGDKEILSLKDSEWENLSQTDFDRLFAQSGIRRTGYHRLLRNIAAV